MKKILFCFCLILLSLASCDRSKGAISVDGIRSISSLYASDEGNGRMDYGDIRTVNCTDTFEAFFGKPYSSYASEDGRIVEYTYNILDKRDHSVRFTFFTPDDGPEELVGVALLFDGEEYYSRSASVFSGGPDYSIFYAGEPFTAADEWSYFWKEISDSIGKTERAYADKEMLSSTVALGDEFFDIVFNFGRPENISNMGSIGFVAEYYLNENERLDLFFAYEKVAYLHALKNGSELFSSALSMAFLCTEDTDGKILYERLFFNDEDRTLSFSDREFWGKDSSYVDQGKVHGLYGNVYRVLNDFGEPTETLNYPNTTVYVYDDICYVIQKGDCGTVPFFKVKDEASRNLVYGRNCNLSLDSLPKFYTLTTVEKDDSVRKYIDTERPWYQVYSDFGLPAYATAASGSGLVYVEYVFDGEGIRIRNLNDYDN